MTKKLKRRFILFTMASVAGLLLFIVAAINILNGAMLSHQSDMVLQALVDTNGDFAFSVSSPTPDPPPSLPRETDFGGGMERDRLRASRFFIVQFDMDGTMIDCNTDHISSVDAEEAEAYARLVLRSGKTSGQMDGYKYAVKESGTIRYAFFIDIAEQRAGFRTVLFVSVAIAALCFVVLFVIVVLLSGKVIHPVTMGMEKQKQFITNAGHEMKTPLAIITSNNDTMALIYGENKYNGNIRAQARRLNTLMSDLLTLARLDEEIPLPMETINVSELVAEIASLYREEAEARGLSFTTQIEPAITLKTHRDSFRQLLSILLDNARKYTSAGGAIHLSLTRSGRHILLTEENTCDPAANTDPEKLFERFYRGDAARTQKAEISGYGIGLSAARAICENFGGRITAAYPSENTIRFTVRL